MENCRTKILGFTLLLGGLALCTTGLWLLVSPAQYQATVRIKLEPDGSDIGSLPRDIFGYDAYFIQTEFEIIQSEIVLSNVISVLNLNEKWGEKYKAGNPFKIDETIRFLKQRMGINLVRNTKLIEISFRSEDPNEAARIANEIAEAYGDYRLKSRQTQIANGIQVLTQSYQEVDGEIRLLQSNVDLLREKFKIPTNDLPAQNQKIEAQEIHELQPEQPYWEAKRKLDDMIEFHKVVAARIEAEKLDIQIPKTSMVQIVDVAQPPKFPVSPNRWLGSALLVIGLFPTLGGFLFLKSSRRQSA
jgi:uncharacterized protein involved in exopolysaccharide biosynthesis